MGMISDIKAILENRVDDDLDELVVHCIYCHSTHTKLTPKKSDPNDPRMISEYEVTLYNVECFNCKKEYERIF